MRIAMMGSGGIGGYFGGRMAAAGADVTFIARGRHLDAIRHNGLKIDSAELGDAVIHPAQATDNPAEAVITAAPMTVKRVTAIRKSRPPATAARRKTGRTRKRPIRTMTTSAMRPSTSARATLPAIVPLVPPCSERWEGSWLVCVGALGTRLGSPPHVSGSAMMVAFRA